MTAAGWRIGGKDRCLACAHLANPLAARWLQLRVPWPVTGNEVLEFRAARRAPVSLAGGRENA